jgi:hypothetical protein
MTTAYTTVMMPATKQPQVSETFEGVVDRKGRTLGAIAVLGMQDSRLATQEELALQDAFNAADLHDRDAWGNAYTAFCKVGFWGMAAGTYYTFTPCSTRNGGGYGASATKRYFTTEAERDAVVAKYLKDARKRAVKAAAKDLAKVAR